MGWTIGMKEAYEDLDSQGRPLTYDVRNFYDGKPSERPPGIMGARLKAPLKLLEHYNNIVPRGLKMAPSCVSLSAKIVVWFFA